MRHNIFFYTWLLFFLSSCWQGRSNLSVKGSDTEVNLSAQMAEDFHKENTTLFVAISGGGSGLGIAALMNGTAEIANSSRSLSASELLMFEKKGIEIDSFVFAQDAIALVVSDQLPLDSISIADLAKILSGEYKDWSALTSLNKPINIYGRQSNSGTYEYVRKKLGIEFSPNAKEMNGNAQILESIKTDDSGIGYVGAGYVSQGGVTGIKVLAIFKDRNSKAVSPLDSKMIGEKKYYLQRPLYQFYDKKLYPRIQPFLDFEKSPQGQKIIQEAGYYPINLK